MLFVLRQFDGGMLAVEGVHAGGVALEIGQDDEVATVRPQLQLVGVGAVGTALAGGPPHRSQRAGLPHWALTMGGWRQSAARGKGARSWWLVSSAGRGVPSWPR